MGLFCVDCGKLSLLRERCSGCRLQHFAGDALTPSKLARSKRGEFTLVHVEENSRIEIEINGERRAFDMRGTPTEADIRRLMGELGLTEAETRDLFDRLESSATRVEQSAFSRSTSGQRATGPLQRVDCPDCGRTVAARGWCFYCGHDFTKEETTADARAEDRSVERDEVDRKFLERDVETARDEQPDEARDAYRNRLEGL
ncbi:MAG: hypothetical protein ACOC8B_06250 [Gemmatimonadota bacterium]